MKFKTNLIILPLILSFFVCLPFGCSKKETGDIQITEENGITIVSNPDKPLYPNAKFIYKEELSIGREEGDSNYVFYRASAITVDSDGNIFLLESGNHRVQVFDSDGKFLYSFGKKGQGPGEFLMPFGMVLWQDSTFYIMDLQNRGLLVFKKNGEFLRTINLSEGSPQYFFVDDHENLFIGQMLRGKTPNDQQLRIGKFNSNGELVATFREFKLQAFKFISSGKNMTVIPLMFTPNGSWTTNNRGFVFSGLGDRYEIHVQNPDSVLAKIIKRNWQAIPVTEEDKKEYNARFKEMPSSMIKEVEYCDTKPAFSKFFIDDQNNLWVKLYTEFGFEKKRYDIFDPAGKYLYQIEISISPNMFRNGKVYTIESTEDGVQMIKRYSYRWEK